MNARTPVTVFVGPTAYGADISSLLTEDLTIVPPVRRGDVKRLVSEQTTPGCMAIVDGTFHSYPSVGHVEIRDALTAGWSVWGLSSMGAIRAAEMSHLGMRGWGKVYERYATNPEFSDDEVTLVHEAESPHRPISEPLLHLRAFIEELTEEGLVPHDVAQEVTALLKNRWYGDRSIRLAIDLLSQRGIAEDKLNLARSNFGRCRIKAADLCSFLTDRPWEADIHSMLIATNGDVGTKDVMTADRAGV